MLCWFYRGGSVATPVPHSEIGSLTHAKASRYAPFASVSFVHAPGTRIISRRYVAHDTTRREGVMQAVNVHPSPTRQCPPTTSLARHGKGGRNDSRKKHARRDGDPCGQEKENGNG